MGKIVILFGLLAILGLVESDGQCEEGPRFWCSNLKNAKKCSALNHCVQAVWAVQKYPVDVDAPCTICEEVVVEARKQLASGKNEKEIESLFITYCNNMPVNAITTECVQLVNTYVPEIMQMLASDMDPTAVCTALRLCNNKRIDDIVVEQLSADPVRGPSEIAEIKFNDCDVCQIRMIDFKIGFKKTADQDLMDRMFLICGEFGSYSTSCSMLVHKNFDKIRGWLEKRMIPVEMCQLTNRCIQPKSEPVVSSSFVNSDWCGICTDTLKEWKTILVQNTTEEDFKELLLDLCTEVGFLIDQCRDVVDQYYVPLYDWLMHQFQPKVICQDAGLCPGKSLDSVNVWPVLMAESDNNNKVKNVQIIDHGGLTKDGPLEGDAVWIEQKQPELVRVSLKPTGISPQIRPLGSVESVGAENAQLPVERFTSVFDAASGESCAVCQTVLHEVENYLMNAKTEAEIKQVVSNICDRIPNGIGAECKEFVSRYGDFVIVLLAQKFDPSTVCPKLNLCPAGLDITIVSLAGAEFPKTISYDIVNINDDDKEQPNPVKQVPTVSVTCVVCEYAIGMLQKDLKENATQDEIRASLDALCEKLPSAIINECESLVTQYSEELIDALVLNLTPEQTCRYLMLCQPPSKPTADVVMVAPEARDSKMMDSFLVYDPLKEMTQKRKLKVEVSPGCILCEFVMRELDDILKDNRTEHKIEDDLHKVCSYMPKSVREDCDAFIAEYFEMIVNTLETLPPNAVCSAIMLCMGKENRDKYYQAKKEWKCTVCQDTMKLMRQLLLDDRIDKEISGDLEHLCEYVPRNLGKKYIDQCYDIMEEYGPYVVNMVGRLENPDELCSYVDVCPPIAGMVIIDPSLDNCSLGPKYFCSKKKRAEACQKMDYCKETIWGKAKKYDEKKRSMRKPRK